MKRLAILLILLLTLAPLGFGSPRGHSSRKSHVSGHRDGHYAGGHGRSHKGGHYSNSHTGDHYRDREHGVN
jgi:hypothetical protein